jgi:mono/diheme cytochrome c family protein
MKARILWALPLFVLLVGCSLAGDVTPPPVLATAQAAGAMATASAGPREVPPASTTETAGTAPTPNRRPDPGAGEAIFSEKCAPCHGLEGMGDGELAANLDVPPTALGEPDIGNQATLSGWYTVVTEGRLERFMPPFASLSGDERWDVAAYALSLSTSPEQLAQGKNLYGEECASCHNPDGGGQAEADFSDPAFMADRSAADLYAEITDGGEGMPAYSGSLTADERWAAARYVETLPLAQPAAPEETTPPEAETPEAAFGTIRGQVINGTAGAVLPAGLEVELHGFDGDAEVLMETAVVGDDGTFLFENLEVVPGRLYVAASEYGGILYTSEITHLTEAGETLNMTITIFEATQDTDAVSVDRLHVLFDFSNEGVVRVLELWVISNLGDETIATSEGEGLLEIALPEEAGQPNFEDSALGERYLPTETGFIDRMPLRPGAGVAQLVFDFDMPYSGRLDFDQHMNYPVQAVVVLVDEGGPRITGDAVEDRGLMTVSDLQMQTYALGPLAAGDEMRFRVSGRPRPLITLGGEDTGRNLAIALGVFGAALIGVGAWWYFSRRVASRPAVEAGDVEETGLGGGATSRRASREDLLRAIAELDDAYAAGDVEEAEYQRSRRELKAQALETMKAEDD